MSIRQYDEEPFPYQIEAYHELARGQWVEVRRNDVDVAVGSKGVVLKKVAESGNYQVAVEVEGQDAKRIVALCPDQVRPTEPPLPDPEPAKAKGWTPEKRAAQAERLKAMWERKRAEKEAADAAAAAAPKPEPRRLKADPVEIPDIPEIELDDTSDDEPELVTAIRHVQGYRDRFAPRPDNALEIVQAVRDLKSQPKLEPVTWTRRAADAIRPVLAEAATGGANPTELALLVETISYLEDGGRP